LLTQHAHAPYFALVPLGAPAPSCQQLADAAAGARVRIGALLADMERSAGRQPAASSSTPSPKVTVFAWAVQVAGLAAATATEAAAAGRQLLATTRGSRELVKELSVTVARELHTTLTAPFELRQATRMPSSALTFALRQGDATAAVRTLGLGSADKNDAAKSAIAEALQRASEQAGRALRADLRQLVRACVPALAGLLCAVERTLPLPLLLVAGHSGKAGASVGAAAVARAPLVTPVPAGGAGTGADNESAAGSGGHDRSAGAANRSCPGDGVPAPKRQRTL
jgi:hypothetical protein